MERRGGKEKGKEGRQRGGRGVRGKKERGTCPNSQNPLKYALCETVSLCLLQSNVARSRSLWQDIADWIVDSWPWPSASQSQPLPLRIRPSDIGFDDVAGSRTAVNGTSVSLKGDLITESTVSGQQFTNHDPLVSINPSLASSVVY